jgi:hypothetical protein
MGNNAKPRWKLLLLENNPLKNEASPNLRRYHWISSRTTCFDAHGSHSLVGVFCPSMSLKVNKLLSLVPTRKAMLSGLASQSGCGTGVFGCLMFAGGVPKLCWWFPILIVKRTVWAMMEKASSDVFGSTTCREQHAQQKRAIVVLAKKVSIQKEFPDRAVGLSR